MNSNVNPEYPIKPLYENVHRIETKEQAARWVEHLILELQRARRRCDFEPMIRGQRRAERGWLVWYGTLLGAARALHATGYISDRQYMTAHEAATATLVPTVRPCV